MYEVDKIYHGFKLIEESTIAEIQSVSRIFHHKKSGARLFHLENNDNNKVFSIGFRTPPSDDTGVAHILEHCVLSGSRKYNTKAPFMDMVKGSLHTFMNAMTFVDKTLYPVASRNKKDFFNLMDVYLDAVFYPRIYEIPEIFMQEGWHHEIFNKEEKITYKGVVYNEMKGVYSLPEVILRNSIAKSLFPDTCYKYSFGGEPDAIPDLTYEAFLDLHRKLYHPANSYIFLYGDGNIDEQLAHINDEYLENFDYIRMESHIERQKPFDSMRELVDYYNIGMNDNDENRSYLSLNFVLGDNVDVENYFMSGIISEILIGAEAAPLKKALIDANIGEDILATTIDGIQHAFGITAKNTSANKKEDFKDLVFDTLKKIVKEGIDKELIEASINKVEYRLREASGSSTKGLVYNRICHNSWLYDGDPTSHLRYGSVIKGLRGKIGTDHYERYINDNIINNPHSSLVIIEPKKGLNDEKEKLIEKKLEEYKKSLTDEELTNLIEANNKLRKIQLADDTEEAKATIPKLTMSDIEPQVEVIPQEVIKSNNSTILFQDIFTSKIAYLDLYFDTSMIKVKDIPYINLLADLLGKIDTRTKSYGSLSNYMYVNTGGISFSASAIAKNDDSNKFSPKLIVKGKAIADKIPELIGLMSELMVDTKFDDHDRIKELLLQTKSRLEMFIMQGGSSVVINRVGSYFSPYWKYSEKLSGLEYYWFITDLLKDFDNSRKEIVSNLKDIYNTVFNKNNLVISFTGDKEDFAVVRENLKTITGKLNEQEFIKQEYNLTEEKLNEGILSTSNVQYVAKGYNFENLGYEYNGSMMVLVAILNGDYLHNKIRAQGGAYGAGLVINRAGDLLTYSFRDPNIKETLDAYDGMADFVNNLNLTETELTQFIIGTIAKLEPAMTPYMKGQLATTRYMSNISYENVQRVKDEVLSTKLDDIKAFATLLQDTMKENYICVLGNENKIKENEELFNNLIRIMG